MTTGRHRAGSARHGRHAADPVVVRSPGGSAFRRAALTSSAVVAVAGLSLTMVVPANALPTHSSPRARQSAASHSHAPVSQSYAVPSTVSVEPSVARDDYTATPPALLAARHAAALSALTAAGEKAAAIAAILATVVTAVTAVTADATPAAAATSPSPSPDAPGDTPATTTGTADTTDATGTTRVVTTDAGTVGDRVSKATLEAASATAVGIVASAVQYVGVVPYVHGGADPTTGFDCSGLVEYVYAKSGIAVPHDVDGIAALGRPIAAAALQPGDLVVYPHQHIGIYVGDGYMVDAPDVGRDVEVQKVWGTPTYVHVDGA